MTYPEVLTILRRYRERVDAMTPGPWTSGWNSNQTMSVLAEGQVIAFVAVPDVNPYHKALDIRQANERGIVLLRNLALPMVDALIESAERHRPDEPPGRVTDCAVCMGSGWPCPDFSRISALAELMAREMDK